MKILLRAPAVICVAALVSGSAFAETDIYVETAPAPEETVVQQDPEPVHVIQEAKPAPAPVAEPVAISEPVSTPASR